MGWQSAQAGGDAMRVLMAAAAMALAMEAAQAQPPMPSHYSVDGKYIKGDLDLRKQGLSVVRTGTKSCGGRVEGHARISSDRVVTITRTDEEFPTCVLRIEFTHDYTRARITESNCHAWHGAGCDFDFNGLALRRRN
jgi:hypothetical protein